MREMSEQHSWSDVEQLWASLLSRFLSLGPFSRSNAPGVCACLGLLSSLLADRGFAVEHYPNPSPDGAGVLIATRAPRGTASRTVGLFAHVDVEDVAPGDAWQSPDALRPTLLANGRYYCRGVADNLGPLLARVLSFRASDENCAGVVWVVQGEEEVGSPFAHSLLPALKTAGVFSSVDLWIEETGYFTKDGSQRVLVMHAHGAGTPGESAGALLPIVDCALLALDTNADGRRQVVLQRFLNKSFGPNRCPCIAHLIDGSVPYISFGINDAYSCIHDVDESVPADTLPVAFRQFKAVLAVS